jgi:dTDP-4-amino-4,6-dideoxygalactose transaminase
MMHQEPSSHAPLPFIDLQAQRRRLGPKIERAILGVIDRGDYIMGSVVGELETQLAAFCGAAEAICCASGTDALALVLMGLGVGPGQAILCPSFTFAATAEVIVWFGATPVFVDVDRRTFNMDPASLEVGIATANRLGHKVVGVIPVDLFGQPADYDALTAIAEKHGLWVLCDAAQSFGARYADRKVGTIGAATSISFFPAKPLGCYGDGGAVLTNNRELAAVIRSLRVHGQGVDKYDNIRIGMNGRLDTVQAAVLLQKLTIFPEEIEARNRVAERYTILLSDVVTVPELLSSCTSVWAQYTVRLSGGCRDGVAVALKSRGIPTAIYYPKPLHQQTAYRSFPVAEAGLLVSESHAREVLSLPMHPYLDCEAQDRIVAAVKAAVS